MGLKFILGRGGSGKSTYILEEIKKKAQENEITPIIMLVPEQYTFEMERRMSNLFSGSEKDKFLRTRVLSFKTMSNIVFSHVGGLTNVNVNASGKAMITSNAIESVAKELNIFSKSATQPGFITSVSEMIAEFKQYNVTPEMLEHISSDVENETLGLKLKDISKIYEAFENKLHEKYVDSQDMLNLLADKIEACHEKYVDSQDMLNLLADKIEACSYFDGCYIYIDEFTGFTPNQYRVLRSILHKAKEVNMSLTVDSVANFSYNKTDSFSRTKFTYERLSRLALEEGVKIDKPSFSRTKFTYERLSRLALEEGVKIDKPINLNNGTIQRFKGNKELHHLERYYSAYPYKVYEEETKNIHIKEFNNLYSEVEEIAREIVHLVRDKKVRYKDITIATRDLNRYDFLVHSIFNEYNIPNFIDKKREAKSNPIIVLIISALEMKKTRDLNRYDFLVHSIFNEYNIPNFIDKKREAKSNPIIVLIISALEMKNRRYSYETMFRYLKSGLIGIDNDDISLLENYVLANGIRGKKWFEERWNYRINCNYNIEESDYEISLKERINEIKSRVISPIIKLQNKLIGKKTVQELCQYVYEFLLDIDMPNTIEKLIFNFKDKGELDIANQYSQVWDIVVDILDQMVEIMGDEKKSLEEFIRLISLGFDEYELGLVPPSIDQVLVSSVDRMKNSNTKYLYLIGTTDGIFPLIAKDNGLLSDNDRESLGEKGVEVDIDSKTKTFEEQFLVYKALTSTSENLIVTYPISDHEGKTLRPSVIVSRLKKIFPNISNISYLIDEEDMTNEEY